MTDQTPSPGGHPAPHTEARKILAAVPLFAGLDEAALRAVEAELEFVSFAGGSVLFSQGDEGDDLYIVAAGRLRASVRDSDGRDRVVAFMAPGETAGEMAVISGERRTATIVAARDSDVWRLNRASFESLLARYPAISLALNKLLVARLRRAVHRLEPVTDARTVAFVPLHRNGVAATLARALAGELSSESRRVAIVDSGEADIGAERLYGLESANDLVFYVADEDVTPWTELCLRQADRVLLVASLQGQAAENVVLCDRFKTIGRSCEMVVVHDAERPATGSVASVLRRAPVGFHNNIRLQRRQDLARLGRLITGRAVGLVLGGGGARGMAHIGVLRALTEGCVPVDLIGGTSMGSIIAAGAALEATWETIRERMRAVFVDGNPLSDYTLPIVALLRGRKVSQLLRDFLGEVLIEDLWRYFFCVSSNLTTGKQNIHRSGLLWRAVRASVSIPGLLPPVVEQGDVLVDGGLLNNLPTDVMSQLRRGPIIAVDVTSDRVLTAAVADLEDRSLWSALRNRGRAPGIAKLLVRAGTVSSDVQRAFSRSQADLLLEPPLGDVDMLSWDGFDRAYESGYRHTLAALERLDRGGLLGSVITGPATLVA
jgi:NTE family protein